MMPPVLIILLTYKRTEYALRTIASAIQHLRYPALHWYIADDGSEIEHLAAVDNALRRENVYGKHTLPGGTYGANANIAWSKSIDLTPLTLWLEDDWELRETVDLMPFASLLMERNDIGMVRLGYLNLGMRGVTFGHSGHLYWELDRDSPDAYVFTGHPSLRHWRFRDAYGEYTPGRLPGETELDMAWSFRTKQGPGIVWPGEWPVNGHFGHIGQVQSY